MLPDLEKDLRPWLLLVAPALTVILCTFFFCPEGPLTVFENGRHTLVGISSTFFQQCGQFPSVYARVTSAVHWIKQVVYYGIDGGK